MKWLGYFRIGAVLFGLTAAFWVPAGKTVADLVVSTPILVPNVNSNANEGGPTISADMLELYFDSDDPRGHGNTDIWVSTRESVDDPWSLPVNLGQPVNTSADEGQPHISPDGLELYFHSGGNLWVARRPTREDAWQERIWASVNTGANEWDPSLPYDELELFFSSDRYPRIGWTDIWLTTRESKEKPWTGPVNLGDGLNSNQDDCMPSVSPDGLVLFFASRRETARDFDLYVTTRMSRGSSWLEPINLGPKVNTLQYSESSPCISPDGRILYFSDWPKRRPAEFGGRNLWQVDFAICGDQNHPYPMGDLNHDCRVDFFDLAMLSIQWLNCTDPICELSDYPGPAVAQCLPSSHPDYVKWVLVGKPDCWCCATQCHGDSNCDGVVDGADLYPIEPLVGRRYPDINYNVCFDFDHDGDIDYSDLNIVILWYNRTLLADCL